MILLVSLWYISGLCLAQQTTTPSGNSNVEKTKDKWKRDLAEDPVRVLDYAYGKANEKVSNEVQNTDLDVVSSKVSVCDWIAPDMRFSITRTLCSIKQESKDYLQYVVYFGLAVATFFLIRNGFKIVTSSDREKQISAFKKNLLYVIVWVVLLIGFYYIIDIFVSVVNMIAE